MFTFDAEVWRWQSNAGWYFVTLPADVSDEIDARESASGLPRKGFGSVRVEVTIGDATWATSVFPDTKRGAYVLPVKAAVRKAAGLDEGSRARLSLDLL